MNTYLIVYECIHTDIHYIHVSMYPFWPNPSLPNNQLHNSIPKFFLLFKLSLKLYDMVVPLWNCLWTCILQKLPRAIFPNHLGWVKYCSNAKIALPMYNCMLHLWGSVNLTIYLYAQTMGQRRLLYIHKFYVVNLYCIYLSIYLYKNELCVCMFVCL